MQGRQFPKPGLFCPPELEESMTRLAKALEGMPERFKELVFRSLEQGYDEKIWEHPDGPEKRYVKIMQEIHERDMAELRKEIEVIEEAEKENLNRQTRQKSL